jgi:hypothetical protein
MRRELGTSTRRHGVVFDRTVVGQPITEGACNRLALIAYPKHGLICKCLSNLTID